MSRVAVVVPAHRETGSLAAVVTGALQQAERPRVVVAVDGGHPPTVEAARRAGAEVVELADNRGSYAARNAALARLLDADGPQPEVVVFTDADCVVTGGWLAAHLDALRTADLSGGDVRFTFRGSRPTPAEWVDAARHLKQRVYVERDGFAATCNLAVRAEALREQRFDGSLRTGGDAELCRRLTATGARLVFTPDAVVEHPARDLRALWTKVDRLARGVPGQAERWRGRELPPRRLTRGVWRRARAAGHDVGPLWGTTACLLDWLLSQRVRRAVLALPREAS
jgi:glycosyltransferase involved in cell wall biosynthesis